MPGYTLSAKRLGHIRRDIDAPRHNSTPLLRESKKAGGGFVARVLRKQGMKPADQRLREWKK
ncbi:hypothetical protein HDG33_002897 [Paraburkholderia sp. Cpub6]|nr:hypothetical protein [Paraburkholderia sp. Cpub6]